MSGGQDRTVEGHPAGLRERWAKRRREGLRVRGGLHDNQGLVRMEGEPV